jgi:hypothetical protein
MSLLLEAVTLEDSINLTKSLGVQSTLEVLSSLGIGLMLTLRLSFLAIVSLSSQLL